MTMYRIFNSNFLFAYDISCTLCTFADMCACSQHDAQELLRYLLEGLHEDLNRKRGKKRQPIDEREYDLLEYACHRCR